jgi:hypothetical protein
MSEDSMLEAMFSRLKLCLILGSFFVPIIAAVWVQRENMQLHTLGAPLPALAHPQYVDDDR